MGKKSRRADSGRSRAPAAPQDSLGKTLGMIALAGVALLAIAGIKMWGDLKQIREDLDERRTSIDQRVAQLSTKLDAVEAAAKKQPTRRGPDPDRVYKIKTAGAPSLGPASAPVTIAEFSDFQ